MAQLIPFLDVPSALALATVQPLLLDMLQRNFIWRGLLRRSTIREDKKEFRKRLQWEWGGEGNGRLEVSPVGKKTKQNRREMNQLVEFLQMAEDPEPLLMDLLDTICERFSRKAESGRKEHRHTVLVSCNHHPDHLVSPEGFALLELAEGIMGTTLQKAKEVEWFSFVKSGTSGIELVSALLSRIVRQKEVLQRMSVAEMRILGNREATAILMQNTIKWDINLIQVDDWMVTGDFGEEGWAWLADGIQRNRGILRTMNPSFTDGNLEDFKTVWDGMDANGYWDFGNKYYVKGEWKMEEDGEIVDLGWRRIEKILKKVKMKTKT